MEEQYGQYFDSVIPFEEVRAGVAGVAGVSGAAGEAGVAVWPVLRLRRTFRGGVGMSRKSSMSGRSSSTASISRR